VCQSRQSAVSKWGGVACEEGLTGSCAKDVGKDWETLWRVGWGRGKGGLSAKPYPITAHKDKGGDRTFLLGWLAPRPSRSPPREGEKALRAQRLAKGLFTVSCRSRSYFRAGPSCNPRLACVVDSISLDEAVQGAYVPGEKPCLTKTSFPGWGLNLDLNYWTITQ